jgi:hypothetical protein
VRQSTWYVGHYWAHCISPGWWVCRSWWNENWQGNRSTQCHFVHHKSYVSCREIEPGPTRWEAGGKPPLTDIIPNNRKLILVFWWLRNGLNASLKTEFVVTVFGKDLLSPYVTWCSLEDCYLALPREWRYQVKVNFSLCLIKYDAMKTYGGMEVYVSWPVHWMKVSGQLHVRGKSPLVPIG